MVRFLTIVCFLVGLVGCQVNRVEFSKDEFQKNLEKWKGHKISKYRYDLVSHGMRLIHYTMEIHGAEVKVTNHTMEEDRVAGRHIVEIFGLIDSYQDVEGIRAIEVDYDAIFGYPRRFCLRYKAEPSQVIDGNFCYTIEKFSPIP